jgi:transposase
VALGLGGGLDADGAVHTSTFNVYLERVLGPTVRRGDILVLDNLGAHRASRIEEMAAGRGAPVIRPVPYSPDFSPIELMWSKIKAALRATEARTREELERALVSMLELVTGSDCLVEQKRRHPESLSAPVLIETRKTLVIRECLSRSRSSVR